MPSKWLEVPLEQLKASTKSAFAMGPFGSKIKAENFTTAGVPVIKGGNLNSGYLDESSFDFLTQEKADELESAKARRLDIVITHRGTLGQVGLIPEDSKYEEYVVSQSQLKMSFDRAKVDPYFVYYFLMSPLGQSRLLSNVSQVGVPAIAQALTSVRAIEIPLPESREEQVRISRILRELDQKIYLNRRINQTLEAMAQAIFKSWFVDFDPVKAKIAAKTEGRDPLRAAMTAICGKPDAELDTLPPDQFASLAATAALFPDEMEDSELGEIPKGWNVGTFKDCCLRVESGGTPSRKEPAFWGGSIPWLTSGEVRDVVVLDTKEKISRAGLDASSAKFWPAMSTVVAMYGATAGQVCLIANEMTANQACCALIPKAAFKTFIFIAARQSVQKLAEKASGSAQQNLNKSLVENHVHVIPDYGVADRFELATTSLLQKWVLNQREAATLAQHRDTLLPKLLSGELVVPAPTGLAAAVGDE